MGRRPLLCFTVCWVAGSALACRLNGGSLVSVWCGMLFLLAALAVWRRLGWKAVAVLGLSFTLSGLYWEWSEARNVSVLPEVLTLNSAESGEIAVRTEGIIISAVERDGDRVDFMVRITGMGMARAAVEREELLDAAGQSAGVSADKNWAKAKNEKILVQVKLEAEEEISVAAAWRRGDRVNLGGQLEQPSVARNFGGFDYRAYLLTQQVHWLLKVTGSDQVRTAPPRAWSMLKILRLTDTARGTLGAELDALFQGRHSGYMKGLVIGMQEDLDPETFQQFSQLGLTHILAISGMHVAVYVGVLLFLLLRLRLTKETALTTVFVLVPVYVLLSGAGPSVVRAGIMSMIALYAARRGVLKDGMNILSASALLMLVWNPYFLLSVSFQLSFLVTAGLMVYVPLAVPLLSRLPRWLSSSLAVTLVAQFVSFPLTLYYFNQFSLLSFAANFVLVPFITFAVLPLGTAALLLGRLWGGAAQILAAVTEWLNNRTFDAVEWMNGWTSGVMIWRSPSLLWIAVYYLLWYGLLYAAKTQLLARRAPQYAEDETRPLEGLHPALQAGRNGSYGSRPWDVSLSQQNPLLALLSRRLSVWLLGLCLGLLLYIGYQPEQWPGAGSISFLDVGQGDSMLITTPGGSHILVDGGGTVSFGPKEEWRIRRNPFEVGSKVLLPLLKKRGIHRLDAIILTHGDQDHAGGLQAVLEGIPVSALLFNGTVADREPYLKLMRTALDRNIRLYGIHQGMTVLPDKETKLSFVWPLEPAAELDAGKKTLPIVEEQNHESVVFRLSMSGRNFLFTGDMDSAAEEEIMAMGLKSAASQDVRIDVLKIAHHGSKTSTGQSWLDYWKPISAVISAGVNNLYGHPSDVVVERLNSQRIQIWRTDRQGEIQMKVLDGGIKLRHKLD